MIKFLPYADEHVILVKQFNERLNAGGCSFSFPEGSLSTKLPPLEGKEIFEKYYLAIENDSVVRGGYILKQQPFQLNSCEHIIGNIQLPLSEGIIDKAFNIVGVKILFEALNKLPLSYCLGMGGEDKPLPKLLKACSWNIVTLPFKFKILNAHRFLRQIVYFRRTFFRRLLLDIVAYSGMGTLIFKVIYFVKGFRLKPSAKMQVTRFEQFGTWADTIWDSAKKGFDFCAVRNAVALNTMYPPEKEEYIRLKVADGDKLIGWVLCMATKMKKHNYFGNMKVGSIIDCLALHGNEEKIIIAATDYLARQEKVDIIVSNQAAKVFNDAFDLCGYFSGPSNFVFASSPKLSQLIYSSPDAIEKVHINRGDGDGPMHL